jgi:hypothetical protein
MALVVAGDVLILFLAFWFIRGLMMLAQAVRG